jgi:hypothetical protein
MACDIVSQFARSRLKQEKQEPEEASATPSVLHCAEDVKGG